MPNNFFALPSLGFQGKDPRVLLPAIELLLRAGKDGPRQVTIGSITAAAKKRKPATLPEDLHTACLLPRTCDKLAKFISYWFPEARVTCVERCYTPRRKRLGPPSGANRHGWRLAVRFKDSGPMNVVDTAARMGSVFNIYEDMLQAILDMPPPDSEIVTIQLPVRCREGVVLLLTQDPTKIAVKDLFRVGQAPWNPTPPDDLSRLVLDWHVDSIHTRRPVLVVTRTRCQGGGKFLPPDDIDSIAQSFEAVATANEVYGYDLENAKLYLLKSRRPVGHVPCEIDQRGPLRMTVTLEMEFLERRIRDTFPMTSKALIAALRGEDLPEMPSKPTREQLLLGLVSDTLPDMVRSTEARISQRLTIQSAVPEAEEPEKP